MKNVIGVCALFASVFVSGCAFSYSYNMQRASARSGGDMGMTAIMDLVDPTSQAQIDQYGILVDEIIVLLGSNHIGTMTQAQLQTQLNKIVPEAYSGYSASLIAFLGGMNIPLDSVLPEKAVLLMKDFCNGSKRALSEYTMGKNTKTETEPSK